jgi:hypothetical protein
MLTPALLRKTSPKIVLIKKVKTKLSFSTFSIVRQSLWLEICWVNFFETFFSTD